MKTMKQFGFLFVLILSLASCTKQEVKSTGDNDDGGTTPFGELCACAANTQVGSTCIGTDGSTVCDGTLPSGGNCACAAVNA